MRRLEPAAVIANGEGEGIARVIHMNPNLTGARMANGIADGFLPDAAQMVHAAGGQRYLFAFDLERGLGFTLNMIGRERARESLGKNAGDLIGFPQIPDDAPRFCLAMRDHAARELARFGRRCGREATIAEEL